MKNQRRLSSTKGRFGSVEIAADDPRSTLGARSVFFKAFMAGLAAPTMLFAASPAYVVYDADASVPSAWRSVARNVSAVFDARAQ